MAILQKLNFVEILSLGISGFGFLLILLSFLLIYKEQKRKTDPRMGILSIIKYFIAFNFLNTIVVGILGLPAIQRNAGLRDENQTLTKEVSIKENQVAYLKTEKELDSAFNALQETKDNKFNQLYFQNLLTEHAGNIDSLAKNASYPDKEGLLNYKSNIELVKVNLKEGNFNRGPASDLLFDLQKKRYGVMNSKTIFSTNIPEKFEKPELF